jgi:hypothetical protein
MNILKALFNIGKVKTYLKNILTVVTKVNAVLISVETQIAGYENISGIKEVAAAINTVQTYLENTLGLLGIPKEVVGLSSGDVVADLKKAVADLRK